MGEWGTKGSGSSPAFTQGSSVPNCMLITLQMGQFLIEAGSFDTITPVSQNLDCHVNHYAKTSNL